jgi:glycosyltransferase involved in cell wall biosynthesis
MLSDVTVILIAPNVSEQMGGEAMKALQIFQELKRIHPNTFQITHERNESEVCQRQKLENVLIVRDDPVAVFIWRSVILRWLIDFWFSQKAIGLAETYAKQKNLDPRKVIVHQTEPNSPVLPRALAKGFINVFGPINGNIYYPEIFRIHESLNSRLRRIFHFPSQKINNLFFNGLRDADLIFVAGGDRTKVSILAGGAQEAKIVHTIDCGIKDEILNRSRIKHIGQNHRFVHFGRLVFHKGTFLIIESLLKTKERILIDIVGKGPELERCQALAEELNVKDRVNFLGWYSTHSDLLDSLYSYRGLILPSIEDANGIVVQEGMALGLPPICLDWGGPQLLVQNGITGYLVEPISKDHITSCLAVHMDTLANDDQLAERMSVASRERAEQWRWSAIVMEWVQQYANLIT